MDQLTGLVWTRNANLPEFPLTWTEVLDFVARMNAARQLVHADWRLPNNVNELESLVDCDAHSPALEKGRPFRDARDTY